MLAEDNKSQFFGDFESRVDVNFTEEDVKNFEGYEWEKRVHGTLSILNDRISGVIRALQEVKEPEVVKGGWKDPVLNYDDKARLLLMMTESPPIPEDEWKLTYLEWKYCRELINGADLPDVELVNLSDTSPVNKMASRLNYLRFGISRNDVKNTIKNSPLFIRAEDFYGEPPIEHELQDVDGDKYEEEREVKYTD